MPKTKIEIIDETVEFYGADPKGRRSLNPEFSAPFGCLYRGPDGRRCAFARCLENSFVESLPECLEGVPASCLLDNMGGKILKPEYQGHDRLFWNNIQQLHDDDRNWDDVGLSSSGKAYVEALKQKYAE